MELRREAARRADVLLVSYPKCGRTWLTMLLSRVLGAHAGVDDIDYLATDLLGGKAEGVPHIRISHDDNPHCPQQITCHVRSPTFCPTSRSRWARP